MSTREEAVADTMMEDIADVINDHNDSDADNQGSNPQVKSEYSSEEGESPLSDRSATHSGSCRSKSSLSNGSRQVTTVGTFRKSEVCRASNDSSQAKETDAVTNCLENRSLQETVSHHTDAHSDFGPPYMLPHTSSHNLPTPSAKCQHKAEPSLPDGFPIIANQSNISRYIEDIIKDSLKSGNVFQTQQSLIKHHKCKQCQYSCNFLFELSQHKMSHILGSLYVCDLCQSSYQYFIDLKTHLLLHAADMTSLSEQFDNYSQYYHGVEKSGELEHDKEYSFTCSICQLLCRDKKELKRHELMHTDEQQFSSDMDTFSYSGEQEKQSVLCQDNSTGSKQIGKSMKEHSHTCSICQFSCSSAKQLKMHGKIHVKSKPSSSNVVDSPSKKADRVKKKERIRKTKMPDSVKKQYSCESCNYKCRSKSQLKVHMKEHEDSKTYSCDLCNLKFSQLSRYKRHKKVHIGGEKLYSCDLCPFTGAKARDLKVHQRQHTGEKPYSCDVCKCTFTQWGHLQLHRRLHTDEKPFSCEFCDYTCSRSDSLKRHRRVHTGEKPYSCEFCEYKCAQINQLREHRRKHTGEKPFKCDFCGSFFKQYSTFQRHRKRHLEAFYCDLCDFKCKKLEDLEIHKKVHTKKPTYPSYLYDINACKQIVELVEQSKRESEVRPYSCDNCEYTCSRLDALKRHRRLHTGEKPYACDLCDYTCSQPDHLKRHRRVHTGERPYICDLCSRTFTESGHLKVHRRLHTGEKPYSCSLCKFTCARLDGLKRHQKSHAAVLPVIADI